MKNRFFSIGKVMLKITGLMVFMVLLCQNISAQEADLIMYEPTETQIETQTSSTTESLPSSPQTGENSDTIIPVITAICAAAAGISAFIIGKKRTEN